MAITQYLLILLLRLFTLPQSRTYNPNARGSDACRGSNSLWTRTLDRYTRAGLPEMYGQHNGRASAEDNTGQNTDNGHTPNPRTEIKIPDPAGNRTRVWKAGTLPTTPRRRIDLILANQSLNNYNIILLTLN